MFPHVRDFLCARNATHDYSTTGIGWTIIDSYYAVDEDNITVGDWYVIYSSGEDGNQNLYCWIKFAGTSIWYCTGYNYWDSVTHTGTGYYGHNTYGMSTNSTNYFFIAFGDLNMFAFGVNIANLGVFNYAYGMGKGESPWNISGEHQVSGALTAGSDVSIDMGDSSHWLFDVDRYAFIRDEYNVVERFLIKTNNGVDTITADLVNSYAAGAYVQSSIDYISDRYSTTWFTTTNARTGLMINGAGAAPGYAAWGAMFGVPTPDNDPALFANAYTASRWIYYDTTNGTGTIMYFPLWMKRLSAKPTALAWEDTLIDTDGVTWQLVQVGGVVLFLKESD